MSRPVLINLPTNRTGLWFWFWQRWPIMLPGALALLLMLGISVMAFVALAGWGDAGVDTTLLQEPWFWRVLQFSIWQALLSALLSVLLALPVARALALDQRLPGKSWFLRWCLLCFVMPSLVLITGLVALFGRSGLLTPLLPDGWNLYGLSGILLAHVFLNLPFALRVFTFQWQSIPQGAWKMSAQLGLSGWQRFRLVELPALRAVVPAVTGFVFLLCFNSFAVVLALGGGPRATTLEVAIFQALKYDFNPPEALFLAWTQLLVAGGLYLMFSRWGGLQWLTPLQPDSGWRPHLSRAGRIGGGFAYLLCVLFLSLPVLVLIPTALQANLSAVPWQEMLQVSLRSVILAISAACLALLLALAVLSWWRRFASPTLRRLIETAALHHLVIPGMVLSVGVYVMLMPWLNWQEWGWLAIILLNALVALPFVFQQLKPRVFEYDANYRPLLADLGLGAWPHWKLVYGPFLKPVLQRVFAISFVLALGDFAIFGIFGNDEWRTLPWMIYTLSGSYRLAEAALASLLLLMLALVALRLLERNHA
ncbi:ABC transporter permease subunit [Nitrincola alkalilacustris]|uniref:ABC transporter permease subunit n=1 Tax=Nitrincola alkalilacustris TaxID=1571224 RepID=UPI00124E7904|nr:ABC transporter permease subunit [Nitrincola alkalilacustris]